MTTLLSRCGWFWSKLGATCWVLLVLGFPAGAGPTIMLPPVDPFAAAVCEQPLLLWAVSPAEWYLGVDADMPGVVWQSGELWQPAGTVSKQLATGAGGSWQEILLGFSGGGEAPGLYEAALTFDVDGASFLALWEQESTWSVLAGCDGFLVHQDGEDWDLTAGTWSTWPAGAVSIYWQGQRLLGEDLLPSTTQAAVSSGGLRWRPSVLELAAGDIETVELFLPAAMAGEELVLEASDGVEAVPGSWTLAGRPVAWRSDEGRWVVPPGGGRLAGQVRGRLPWGEREWLLAAVGEHEAPMRIQLQRGAFGDDAAVSVEAPSLARVLTPQGPLSVKAGTSFAKVQPGLRPWVEWGDEPRIHWLQTIPGSLQRVSLTDNAGEGPRSYAYGFAAFGSRPGWSAAVADDALRMQAGSEAHWEAAGSLWGGRWSLDSEGSWQWSAALSSEAGMDWGPWRWSLQESGWRGHLAGERLRLRLDVSRRKLGTVALAYGADKGQVVLSPERQSVGVQLPVGYVSWARGEQDSEFRWRHGPLDVGWSSREWRVRGSHPQESGELRWELASAGSGWDWLCQWETANQQLTLEFSQSQSWNARGQWMGVWESGQHEFTTSLQAILFEHGLMLEAVNQWRWRAAQNTDLDARSVHHVSDGVRHAVGIRLTVTPLPWVAGSVGWDSRTGWEWQAAVVQVVF